MLYPHSVGVLPWSPSWPTVGGNYRFAKSAQWAILDPALILVRALNPGVFALVTLWGYTVQYNGSK